MIEQRFVEAIATGIGVRPEQVSAAIALLDKGATAPFVARYRKDVTGNLNEGQLEHIQERNAHFIALMNRRQAIVDNVAKQGKLTEELQAKLEAATDQLTLEDLYLPFRKQRRTKASIARDRGLEPLAEFIWAQTPGHMMLLDYAATFINSEKSVISPEEALVGAGDILAERVAMDAGVRAMLREKMLSEGKVVTSATRNAEGQKTKFEAFYNYSEPLKDIPPQKLLAILRGLRTGVLRMDLVIDDAAMMAQITGHLVKFPGTPFEECIRLVVEDAYKRQLRPAIENEVIGIARKAADEKAIRVFRENAGHLLLAAPAGAIAVAGINPSPKAGFTAAVVNAAGAYQGHASIPRPEPDQHSTDGVNALLALVEKHDVCGIAIGNGAGGREAARFVGEALKKYKKRKVFSIFVTDAGTAIHAASRAAREEFPELDTSARHAVSIARRLQDPLAELVRLDPRHIGIGQYQHDVNQRRLREALYKTVESSVSRVGADVNRASPELLRYVSGIQMGTAQNIVEYREKLGGYTSRAQFNDVPGIGEKTFEQCAGFLRIRNGDQVLDSTSIHPEAYPVVEKMAESVGASVAEVVGNRELIGKIDFAQFASDSIGERTLADIRAEFLHPGRDPRRTFKIPKFIEGVYDVGDLEEGMETDGVVTSITDFGAFVNIGVQQDGLIHLSEMANRFVRDPRQVVEVGDIIRVKVIKVNKEGRRISLSRKAVVAKPRRTPRATRGQEDKGAQAKEKTPEARKTERRPRPSGEQSRKPRRESPRRPPKRHEEHDRRPVNVRKRAAAVSMGNLEGQLGNTQLAEQLAALRDKLSS